MFFFYLPVVIVVTANIIYDISSKSVPGGLNAYAGITVTFSMLACLNFIVFKILNPGVSLFAEWTHINWAVIVLGLASIGLESGFIFLYRAGWNISIGGMVCNILLAISMLTIGYLFFQERISAKQFIGVLLCFAGLLLINRAGTGRPDTSDERKAENV